VNWAQSYEIVKVLFILAFYQNTSVLWHIFDLTGAKAKFYAKNIYPYWCAVPDDHRCIIQAHCGLDDVIGALRSGNATELSNT
jgi:hypothetical protein